MLKQLNTELDLGVVREDDLEGTDTKIEAAKRAFPDISFGVATECRLGRVSAEQAEIVLKTSCDVTEPVMQIARLKRYSSRLLGTWSTVPGPLIVADLQPLPNVSQEFRQDLRVNGHVRQSQEAHAVECPSTSSEEYLQSRKQCQRMSPK